MLFLPTVAAMLLPVILCAQGPDQDAIETLIRQLGSPRFQEREVASQKLRERWPDAADRLFVHRDEVDADGAVRIRIRAGKVCGDAGSHRPGP